MRLTAEPERSWLAQWRAAAVALERQRIDELRALSTERALAASEALLSLAEPDRVFGDRRSFSGLVGQQALFHRRRR